VSFARFTIDENEFKATGNIILQGQSCIVLKQEVESIVSWRVRRGEIPRHIEIDCNRNPVTRVNITKIIPNFVQQSYGISPRSFGPNCFNAALVECKLRPNKISTDAKEFRLQIRDNCRQRTLEDGDVPEPGDVGVVQTKRADGKIMPEHGFIFVGKTVFTKNGVGADPYRIQDINDMFVAYNVEKDPRCEKANGAPAGCKFFVNYFSCQEAPADRYSDLDPFEKELSDCAIIGKKTKRNQAGLEEKAFIDLVKNFDEIQDKLLDPNQAMRSPELNKAIMESYFGQMIDIIGDPVRNRKSWNVPERQKELFNLMDTLDNPDPGNENLKKVELIIDSGIDPNIRDIGGTPLLWRIFDIRSSEEARQHLLTKLFNKGVSMHKTYKGKLPLTYVYSVLRNESLAMQLITRGADPNKKDKEGNSFISLLQEDNKQDLISKLKNAVY
jgi:hypothetical protein